MRRLSRVVIPLLLLIAATMAAKADRVDDYIKVQLKVQHIPGLSLAVVRDGKIIKARGYGYANVELNVPATPRTLYQLASLSKQFTAAAILLLVQDGKVGLDDRLSKYVPDTPAIWRDITLRHLLTHTSGLQREGISTTDKTQRADFTWEEMLKSSMAQPMLFAPGEKYAYSNLGFNLLGLVIEKVSGTPFADFMQQRIFAPLEMTSTRVNDLHTITPNRACGYEWSGGTLRIGEPTSPSLYIGSGAVVSTVEDLARWDASLYTDRLLTVASRKQMWTPMPLKNGTTSDYGFGWGLTPIKQHARVSHDGLLSGFQTVIYRFPEDRLTIIVLMNQSGYASPNQIARFVAREYLPAIRPAPQKVLRQAPAALTAFTGRYEYSSNNLLTITEAKNRLQGQLPTGAAIDYEPISTTTFWDNDLETKITAIKNTRGEVTALTLERENGGKRTIPRIGPLVHTLTPTADPTPTLTEKIAVVLKAIAAGGKEVEEAPMSTPGLRRDFTSPTRDLAGFRSLSFIAADDVSDRGITRHDGKVSRILYYRLNGEKTPRYVLVYLTAENLVTDEDVVDD